MIFETIRTLWILKLKHRQLLRAWAGTLIWGDLILPASSVLNALMHKKVTTPVLPDFSSSGLPWPVSMLLGRVGQPEKGWVGTFGVRVRWWSWLNLKIPLMLLFQGSIFFLIFSLVLVTNILGTIVCIGVFKAFPARFSVNLSVLMDYFRLTEIFQSFRQLTECLVSI